ncbi:Predicted DNA-binding transcriptional regulator YafY, contains an HTH and WYL domains [Microbispora rosea]|uniref:Predicted DNA-binding transcriptional regulator YafY, contains an HTH and WYL domains n=1 Tax=Microbispora rosea TaxID=58117 RepID=A0A1N6YP28_9ACTN|nr:Predicted DNA-binding transcriptional regulator YafY, contains an HTH and WYL domains [Microbispora rosea]
MSVGWPTLCGVNRTDRLYAIVEDLRAISPRCRSARELALRFEVSSRTIERDISALQQAGVPIYAEVGRRGGYALDKSMSLPPLNFTPAEAVAVAIALSRTEQQPFADEARSALRKLVAAMPGPEGDRARQLAARVQILTDDKPESRYTGSIGRVIEEALLKGVVLRIHYGDAQSVLTTREVEPGAFVGGRSGWWYLVAWCRLRDAVRVFRLDRIVEAVLTEDPVPGRPLEAFDACVPDMIARTPVLD